MGAIVAVLVLALMTLAGSHAGSAMLTPEFWSGSAGVSASPSSSASDAFSDSTTTGLTRAEAERLFDRYDLLLAEKEMLEARLQAMAEVDSLRVEDLRRLVDYYEQRDARRSRQVMLTVIGLAVLVWASTWVGANVK